MRVVDASGQTGGDVDCCGDAAFAAVTQRIEQQGLGACENGEVRELPAEGHDALRVAGAVLRTDYHARVGIYEAGDQGQPEVDARHLRDVVEVEAKTIVAEALDDLSEEAEQTIFADPLVIEGRQHEHTPGPGLECRATQAYGVGEGAGSRPR